MGTTNNRRSSSTKTEGGKSKSTSTASPNPTNPETEGGRETDTTQGNPIPVVVELGNGKEEPEATGEKKRKQRPKGLSYNKSGKSKVAQANSQDTVLIMTTLISGSFGIAAARFGKHWELTPEETNAISVPATNILTRLLDSEKLEKYSDGAALLIALCMAIAPRAIVTAATKKSKSNVVPIKPVEGGKPIGGEPSPRQNRETKTGSNSNVRQNAAANTESSTKAFLESVSFPNY